MNPSVDSVAGSHFSRRGFFRFAAGASALASLPILTESHFAAAQRPHFADPFKGIHIDANENPLGPSPAALKAAADILPYGGRYLFTLEMDLVETFAKQEGLDPECVMAFAGSSDPLTYVTLLFTGKDRPLVVADPGYEAPSWAAKAAGNPVIQVPLADPAGEAKHDAAAMLAAAKNPGVIYVCNPNNPTGTCTPRADIEKLVAGVPKDGVVLIDEAYIHLCEQPQSLDFVKESKNVIVLRTFSKLYGMAGLRMGFAIGRKDLIQKLRYYGDHPLPVTAMTAARSSLIDKDLVPARRKIIGNVRTETISWLKAQGYAVTPSESNCFMVNVKRPGQQVQAAMAAKEVYIGRVWPAWPTQVRITVGTGDEMMAFRKAFTEVMAEPAKAAAGLESPWLPARLQERPFPYLS